MAEGSSSADGDIRQLASSLVSEIRAEIHRSSVQGQQTPRELSTTGQAFAVRQESNSSGKRTYRAPSLFASLKSKKAKVEKLITRDFMLLPPECKADSNAIKVPRGEFRNKLSAANLIGKVQFRASMSDVELRKEICYAFATAMGIHDSTIDDDSEFPFQYLQSSGQGTCSLCIPSVSKSFSWTGQEVAGLSKQGRMIYLLAGKPLPHWKASPSPRSTPTTSDDEDDLPEVEFLQPRSPVAKESYIKILDDYTSPCGSNSSDDPELYAALEASRREFTEQGR